MKEAAKVIKDATKRDRSASRGAQGAAEAARRRGTCSERVSNGQDSDACGEPAVIRIDSGLLCAECAEAEIRRLMRTVATVREAVKE